MRARILHGRRTRGEKAHYCLERGRALGCSVNLSAKVFRSLSFSTTRLCVCMWVPLYTSVFFFSAPRGEHVCVHLPFETVSSILTFSCERCIKLSYDPSAGSPTETLLRLLLPLSAPVRVSFCRTPKGFDADRFASPRISLVHSIGSSDGRCVQRAGTESQRAL